MVYITSGSICKELINSYLEENDCNDKLTKLITHDNLMDRCEVYNSEIEVKKRYTELTNKQFRFNV